MFTFAKLLLPPSPSIAFNHSTIKLAGNVHWTKTGTSPALIARVEPSNAIGIHTENVGATFETFAYEMKGEKTSQKTNQKMNENILETTNDKIGTKTKNVPCGTKPPSQLIGGIELNEATVGSAVKKDNEYETGRDCSLPTNVAHDTDLACQEHQGRQQECQFAGTGMCIQ